MTGVAAVSNDGHNLSLLRSAPQHEAQPVSDAKIKPGSLRGPAQSCRRGGRQSPSEGNRLPATGLANLGGCDNPAPTARRNNAALRLRRQCKAPHASHARRPKSFRSMPAMQCVQSNAAPTRFWNAIGRKRSARSERPALGVADQKIAERLHARHRLQLFRIDEERIERRPLFFAE